MGEFLRRVVKALTLLALGFALGLIAAQAQAGTVFLPFIANAGAGGPTPPPSGTVRVVNVHRHVSEGRFYGELVNETPYTVRVEAVTMYLMDAEGLPVDNQTGSAMASILPPGQRTPFMVDWRDDLPAWDSYVVYVSWDPVDRLTVESAELTYIGADFWVLTAEVRNQLSVRVQSLAVGAVLYGPEGQMIGYDDPWGFVGPLGPGDTLTVTLRFYPWDWDTSIEPTACGVIAFP